MQGQLGGPGGPTVSLALTDVVLLLVGAAVRRNSGRGSRRVERLQQQAGAATHRRYRHGLLLVGRQRFDWTGHACSCHTAIGRPPHRQHQLVAAELQLLNVAQVQLLRASTEGVARRRRRCAARANAAICTTARGAAAAIRRLDLLLALLGCRVLRPLLLPLLALHRQRPPPSVTSTLPSAGWGSQLPACGACMAHIAAASRHSPRERLRHRAGAR